MESLLNQSLIQDEANEDLLNKVSAISQESESLLNADELKDANEKLANELSVYDEDLITPPSVHVEYPNGIPPYEIQAQIVFENYVRNSQRLLSGKEKRRLLRECQRNAKKGKYNYMFDKEKIAKREERARKNFEKLNNAQR